MTNFSFLFMYNKIGGGAKMPHTINLPAEFEEIYRLAAQHLNLTIEEFLQEVLLDYIKKCLN